MVHLGSQLFDICSSSYHSYDDILTSPHKPDWNHRGHIQTAYKETMMKECSVMLDLGLEVEASYVVYRALTLVYRLNRKKWELVH